jgi:hypothetical protein
MSTQVTVITGSGSTAYNVNLDRRGPQGIQGEQGIQGIQGIQGEVGPPGPTDYNLLTNVPATFPPSAHTHVVSNITPVSTTTLIGRHGVGSGDAQEVSVGNGVEFSGSGIRRSALTGDVTASAGSNSTTIANDAVTTAKIINDAVTNGKLANMATATIKGRTTAGTGDPEDLSPAQARTVIGVSPALVVSDTAPTTPADGQQWLRLTRELLSIWSTTKNRWVTPVYSGATDADAVAWIDAVIAASGVLLSSERSTKIIASDFFSALKTDASGNLFTLLGRTYFPVWGVAAANAICCKSLTTGTFTGTLTHSAGFVTGDGSTGYFDGGATPSAAGCLLGSTHAFVLLNRAGAATPTASTVFLGAQDSSTQSRLTLQVPSTVANYAALGPNNSTSLAAASGQNYRGVYLSSRAGSAERFLGRNIVSGWELGASDTTSSQLLNTTINMAYMANNNNNTIGNYSNFPTGAYGIGLGMTQAQAEKFTQTVKNFWETLTGLNIT